MIFVESQWQDRPVSAELIERAAQAALAHESAEGDISVVLADNPRLRELNREYLGIDAPTDVLSFPASETNPETGAHYLGDIRVRKNRPSPQAMRLKRRCSYWWCMASCICLDTIMPRPKRKPKCGRRRRRSWDRWAWGKFKFMRSNCFNCFQDAKRKA